MEYKCAFCGHTSQTRCGHHELQAEVGTLIEGNRLLNLQVREAVDALRLIKKEYSDGTLKVAFGLPLEVENVIRKADGLEPIAVPTRPGKRNHDHARGVCNEATCPECKKASE